MQNLQTNGSSYEAFDANREEVSFVATLLSSLGHKLSPDLYIKYLLRILWNFLAKLMPGVTLYRRIDLHKERGMGLVIEML